ncbi:MAG: DUF4349 domain-containing protein [Eubacteriales bacterium]|nr:DUF4349 domain-containing protein [Eubacteriales bacterium]
MIENLECRRFRNRIDAFIDNELSSSEREEMLRHAQQCPECGKLLSEYQDMLSLMQKMDEETEIPQEAAQAWRSAVRDEAEHTRRSASRGWVRALVSVAAAFVLLLGVTGLYRSGVGLPSLGTKGADSYYESYEEGYYYDSYDTGAVMTMRSTAMEDSAAGAATLSNTARTVVMESDGAANTLQTSEAAQERKPMIVRSASRTMQSTAFDEDCASIDTLVYGYRSLTGKAYEEGGTGRSLELSIRIPTETMDDFLTDLKQIGATVRMTDSAEDISRDYYDSRTRLEGLHAQHARLVGLISDAADLSDLIALEDKLYEVQSEIDYLEGSLRDMDSRAQYSNISVSLSEVREYSEPEYVEETLVERIKNGFRDSIDWVVGFMEDMVVAVVAFAPVLVIAVPLLVILMLIIRAIRKKRRR